MSADNYMLIRKMIDGRFGLTMQFMSDDIPYFHGEQYFASLEDAIRKANEESVLEYGISVDIEEASVYPEGAKR